MSSTASTQRARTAALLAGALLALGCGDGSTLTRPATPAPVVSTEPVTALAVPSGSTGQGPRLSGYALASGRVDSLPTTLVK